MMIGEYKWLKKDGMGQSTIVFDAEEGKGIGCLCSPVKESSK